MLGDGRLLGVGAEALRLQPLGAIDSGADWEPCCCWEAAEARDALTRHLYQHVFDFLVLRLNAHLAPPSSGGKGGEEARSLMLLDIVGFEDVGSNSLEQLLINYATRS